MASEMFWYWRGGRLCGGKESLSITEAYAAIPKSPTVARAWRNVLITYQEVVIQRDNYAEYLDELRKKRILEAAEAANKVKK